MIKIDNLSKAFGSFKAVDGISFNVAAGEVLGFLGPNGAGKSTTMKMICGFLTPSAGSVSVCGHDVVKEPLKAKELIGYLPEGAPAYADMTPLQYLNFIAEVRGYKGGVKAARVQAVVEQLALKSVVNRRIDELSKGFKRRVGIAQAILHDPKVLILDEPTDGLDPNQKHQVRNLIKNLSKDKIVIISTHILEEVSAVCNRAIIISQGKLVADERPAELEARSRYHHAVTLQLQQGEDVLSALKQLDLVEDVEVSPESDRCFILIPKSGEDVFPAVNNLIKEKGWVVEQLFVERGRLDDVFRNVTTSKQAEEVA
ncbi:ABC transporter ATP-binding protein [Spartinivicinus poritis]|uniref:ATP-binding cassette domain-containing protein n=1 Tax=Spartinivicinus poritis TaxID=2994640 RepID=A0ABT5U6M1_9GAMM|nr:ATP-binding cassette domain-containing protein [Spartinivicinus sp. A2-2]MDE1462009.1 ATP-binding cassette domain-containing protein [Spartinivicinus sp. A2-2]